MKSKQPYFPNNWKMYKEAPDEAFIPHTFIELMEWKVAGWELPADVACIIRTTNLKTHKTKEFIYKRQYAAEEKVRQLVNDRSCEFTVCTHDALHYIGPDNTLEDD